EKSEIFKSKWTRELQQRKAIREQLKQAANQEARQKQIEQEIQMIEEVLKP
ncbi:tRNA (adenine(22)-N(1))-methyltransferase TrmK, partial [Enterococcus faecium]|nr:tRNA (adenine(22)-N(1))-methyltransferase TrmK [Enterococcus faecium]